MSQENIYRRWKYKSSRAYLPLVAQHDVMTFMQCLLLEAHSEIERLKPLAQGEAGELYKSQLKYWQNALRFIATRMKQGLKSVPNARYLQAKKATDALLFCATTGSR